MIDKKNKQNVNPLIRFDNENPTNKIMFSPWLGLTGKKKKWEALDNEYPRLRYTTKKQKSVKVLTRVDTNIPK